MIAFQRPDEGEGISGVPKGQNNNNIVITFMQCIYNYVPETNRVSSVYRVLQLFCIYSY